MIERLKENLERIHERMGAALEKSGRASEEVCLIGVTKYVDAEVTRALVEAGCANLGESRPQVLWEKADSLSDLDVQWHMIGHLQRNKVKRTLKHAGLIHSVDSPRLMNAINDACDGTVNVLLEVNVSGESNKHGFMPDELPAAIQAVAEKANLCVKGLMCMAGLAGSLDDARREFAMLRELRDRHSGDTPANVSLNELSMGMSGDFDVAIEEGATMVRVGSLLFQGIS